MHTTPALSLQPLAKSERISGVDIARGVALLGILLVNARYFFWPFASGITPEHLVPGLETDTLDAIVWTGVEAFCAFKFISLFSILFGFGIALQASRAAAMQVSRWRLGLRRFAVLLGFGVVHATLIWYGDILVVYAGFGVLVLAISACKPKAIFTWFIVFACILGGLSLLTGVGTYIISTHPEWFGSAEGVVAPTVALAPLEGEAALRGTDAMREVFLRSAFPFGDPVWMQAEITAQQEGPWFDAFTFRMVNWLTCILVAFFGYGWHACTMMLFGAYAFASGLFEADASARRRRIGWRCFCIGVPIALASVLPFWFWNLTDPMAEAFHSIGLEWAALTLPIGYALLLVEYGPKLPALLRGPIQSAGRMALTFYLCESVLAIAIASWWGFGLFAKLGDSELAVMSVGVWAGLALFAWLWLRRFNIGPAEWLWRRLSYGRKLD